MEIERKWELGTLSFADYDFANKKMPFAEAKPIANVTLFDYAEQWLSYKETILAYSTIHGYKTQLRTVFKHMKAKILLKDVTTAHITPPLIISLLGSRKAQNYEPFAVLPQALA
jgi:hypothetical protein